MAKIFIYSTLTQSNEYSVWVKGGADLKQRAQKVIIKGGANIANKHLVTPRGVVTEVTEDELALLEGNKVFQRHKQRGFIVVDRATKAADVEKVVPDMVGRDMSAPLVPQDYELENKKAPTSNAVSSGEKTTSPFTPRSTGKKQA